MLNSLECADLSALCSVATCREQALIESPQRSGVKPPQAKAATGRRTPKS